MYPDAPAGFPYAGADLEQFEPDGVDLGGFQFGATQVPPQQPEKSVSGGVQKEPELISQKTVTTQAISFDLQLEFLDPIFDIASQDIDIIINHLGIAVQVRHEEALI